MKANQPAKKDRIAVRIPDSLRDRLDKLIEGTGLDESVLVRAAMTAVCEEWEAQRMISLPIHIQSRVRPIHALQPSGTHLNETAASAPAAPDVARMMAAIRATEYEDPAAGTSAAPPRGTSGTGHTAAH